MTEQKSPADEFSAAILARLNGATDDPLAELRRVMLEVGKEWLETCPDKLAQVSVELARQAGSASEPHA